MIKRHTDIQEGFALHTVCSLITGLVATTVAAPFDLLKTRYMMMWTVSVSSLSSSIER